MVCVCVCVCGGGGGSVCVVMGMDRLIGVSWVYVCGSVRWTGARGWGRLRKKNTVGKPQENWFMPKSEKKWRLEKNNKEIFKNNILINIEFWDAEGIVKWYGINNKMTFWDGKTKYDRILWCWCSNNGGFVSLVWWLSFDQLGLILISLGWGWDLLITLTMGLLRKFVMVVCFVRGWQ